MSDSRVRLVDEEVSNYDNQLTAMRDSSGKISIYRCLGEKKIDLICSLTDDWTIKGKPVEWGLLPIRKKLRDMDQATHSTLEEIEKELAKDKESKHRSFMNETEAFFSHNRRRFARDWNDINTSSLEKIDNRRSL